MTGARKSLLSGQTTPRKLPGLWGWWKAENAVFDGSDRVSSITAQQGPDWIQNAAGDQPLYVGNVNNGLPVVRFNGVNEFMSVATNTILAQPLTFYLALRQVTWTTAEWIISAYDASGSSQIYQGVAANRISLWGGSAAVTPTTPTLSFGIFTGVINATASAAQWNGGTLFTGSVGTAAWRAGCLGASNGSSPAFFSNIDVAEICVFQAAHDDAQRDRLWQRYFKPRYNL